VGGSVSGMRILLITLATLFAATSASAEVEWVQAGVNSNTTIWGIKGGLQFALHPGGFTGGSGGPRGLIRIGYPTLPNGAYDLINFIAVEPIVSGRKGFSELEKSARDQQPGKLFWVSEANPIGTGVSPLDGGRIERVEAGVQVLSLTVFAEKFENGAHVRLNLSQRSDAPGELKLVVESEPDSAKIDSCILTATMGNKARTRLLYLKDGPVSSLQLYPDYREDHFAPHRIFGLEKLPRNLKGDVMVRIANDEENPSHVQPFGRPYFWEYRGIKVFQYWRKPAAEITPQLSCAVNGRFTYWMSKQPIPGGIAFENFELREPFRSGQSFIFGISPGTNQLLPPEANPN
jgi:hypothetical protein